MSLNFFYKKNEFRLFPDDQIKIGSFWDLELETGVFVCGGVHQICTWYYVYRTCQTYKQSVQSCKMWYCHASLRRFGSAQNPRPVNGGRRAMCHESSSARVGNQLPKPPVSESEEEKIE